MWQKPCKLLRSHFNCYLQHKLKYLLQSIFSVLYLGFRFQIFISSVYIETMIKKSLQFSLIRQVYQHIKWAQHLQVISAPCTPPPSLNSFKNFPALWA